MTVFWPKFSLVVCYPCWFMGVHLLNLLSTTTYVLIIWTRMKLFHPWKSKCLLSFPKWCIICHQSIFVSQFGLKYEGVYSEHLMGVKERAALSLLLRDVCTWYLALRWCDVFKVRLRCRMYQDFILLLFCGGMFHCIDVPQLVYPSIWWWTFGLFPPWGSRE